ncbi:MAG: hypothetical protein KGL95_10710, partial [Patescibacteria group bacterium]|nr:hypothetical protein [Patescibacteria group bacterium]
MDREIAPILTASLNYLITTMLPKTVMAYERELLYTDPEGMLAEQLPAAPQVSVRGRFVFVKGEEKPIAEVPEGLLFDPAIHPEEVTFWARYLPAKGWARRRPFDKPAKVVTDEYLQFARNTRTVEENLAPAYDSVVPGGFYVVRLTEVGRKDILSAASIQQALVKRCGRPSAQYRFLYP